MEELKITGLVAATFTAFDTNGDIRLDTIPEYIEFLLDSGIKNVFVNGSTGEGLSLTVEERKQTAEKWVKLGKQKFSKVVVHIGCCNLKDTQTLMRHAADIGADAVATVPPFYFRTTTLDCLVNYIRLVAEVCPEMPLYYYHIPQVTGVDISMSDFLMRARSEIPSLRGIKFSSKDLFEAGLCVETHDAHDRKYNMLFGCDEQLLAALSVGFDGAVGSLYNYLGHLYSRLLTAVATGQWETARTYQESVRQFVKIISKYDKRGSLISPMKHVMELVGVTCGPPRCPIRSLNTEDKQRIKEELKNIGFFDWIKNT